MKSRRKIIAAIVLFLSIGASGCIPGVTWLPDSSGFVYMSGQDGQNLVYFNVATKKQQIILTDQKIKTAWPAVSPDGKSIAVARLTVDQDKGDTVQIVIYDLQGKLRKESKVFLLPLADKAGGQDRTTTELFWGPREDKILVSISSTRPHVGIYDVKNDELKVLKDACTSAIGGRPARPDGKGFLVTKWTDKVSGFSFVDWDGKERPIAMKSAIKDDQEENVLLLWPYICTSSWQGAKAFASTSKSRLEIDTDKLLGRVDSIDSSEPNGESNVRQQFTFTGSKAALRIVDWTKQVKGGSEHISRLEILDAHQKKVDTLIENAFMALFPSPDGKLVAVRFARDNPKPKDPKEMIWVIDQSGQVLAKVNSQD